MIIPFLPDDPSAITFLVTDELLIMLCMEFNEGAAGSAFERTARNVLSRTR